MRRLIWPPSAEACLQRGELKELEFELLFMKLKNNIEEENKIKIKIKIRKIVCTKRLKHKNN